LINLPIRNNLRSNFLKNTIVILLALFTMTASAQKADQAEVEKKITAFVKAADPSDAKALDALLDD
jgi:hypothetical protein